VFFLNKFAAFTLVFMDFAFRFFFLIVICFTISCNNKKAVDIDVANGGLPEIYDGNNADTLLFYAYEALEVLKQQPKVIQNAEIDFRYLEKLHDKGIQHEINLYLGKLYYIINIFLKNYNK